MPPGRILVTGAGGFVGSHLLPVLRQAFPGAQVSAAGFDVTDADSVRAEIGAVRPDALVHLAAVAAPMRARTDPSGAWQVNLHGTLTVARAVMDCVPECLLLFVSSADVYGGSFRGGHALDETAPLAPLNTYGATKAASDLALGAMVSDGLRAVRVRPFNHTGPGQTDTYVVPNFARQVARIAAGQQAPLLEVGTLEAQRDFLDVRDVCSAYAAILGRAESLQPGTVFNIASGTSRRIGDILQVLLDLAGVRAEISPQAGRVRPGDIAVSLGDASLAARLLGWRAEIPWEQTLGDVLADWTGRVRVS